MVEISRKKSSGPIYCDSEQFSENTEFIQVRSASGTLGLDIPVDVSANVFLSLVSSISSTSDAETQEFIESLVDEDFSFSVDSSRLSQYQECPFCSVMYTEETSSVELPASYVFSEELVYPESVDVQMCESCVTSVLNSISELFSEEKIVLYLRS
jgi:hypothetical protein